MSSPTSAIQLLGGLLSLSPGANAAMPLESGAPPAMALSGDAGGFYSLWMGMAAQGAMSSSAGAAMRQQTVGNSAGNGIELPPASAEQLLQKLDQLLQQAGDDDTDLIESAVELLRLGLQQAAPSEGAVSGDPAALTDSDMSDAELLEYLKALLESNPVANTATSSTLPADDPLPLSGSAKHRLISYLEQKLEAPKASNASSAHPALPEMLSTEEMQEAERLVRQLRAELETARQERVELRAETASSEDKAKLAEMAYAAKSAADQAQAAMTSSGRSAEAVGLSGGGNAEGDKTGARAETGKVSAEAGDVHSQPLEPLAQTAQQLAAERQATDAGDKVDRMVLPPERPAVPSRDTEKEREKRSESASAAQREAYMPNRPVGELPRVERVSGLTDTAMLEGRTTPGEQLLSDRLRAAVSEERSTVVSARTESSNPQFAEAQRMAMPGIQQAQAPIPQAQSTQDALMQKMLNPAWSKALGERAIMMAQQGPRVAEVRLDPPELGALRIRVQIHGSDQVSISFNAPNAAVREVLEQSMPRLREMFAEQGLNLSDASVGDQSTQDRADKEQRDTAAKGFAGGVGDDLGDAPASRVGARKIGLIDYYA